MASIRRTDIIHKKYSKCRLAKSERERVYNRHEAYKWRDSRRVHLAGSFDRWRKLRSSLKLKDSSLAWHLMEAHDKGFCTYCRHRNFQSSREDEKQMRKCDQKEFLPSLLASIRQLCHAHFDYNECIEIIGLLCLEFDKARKENFSLNECMRSDSPYVSKSMELPVDSPSETRLSPTHAHISEVLLLDTPTHEPTAASKICVAPSLETELSTNVEIFERLKQKLVTSGKENLDILCTASSRQSASLEVLSGNFDPLVPSLSENTNYNCSNVDILQTYKSVQACTSSETCDDTEDNKLQLMNSSTCSESERSLEIDIEKMDTSQEEETTIQTSQETIPQMLSPNRRDTCHEDSSETTLPPVSQNSQGIHIMEREVEHCKKVIGLPPAIFKPGGVDQADVPKGYLTKPENMDLPLDMSVLKPIIKKEVDASSASHSFQDYSRDMSPHKFRSSEGSHLELSQLTSSAGKRKISETNSVSSQSLRQSPFWLKSFQTLPGKMKEEGHASIPWQRRDMSRKEEYEYLEMNPFSDLADFSQRYPHVHQRTYYRWKRRIKEEYIILEQCPAMSFQEFSSVVLQAKESVFCHWKSLISQGKGFFALSDTSKRLEAKSPLKPSSHHNNSAYAFMQKNLTFTYEQFCQQYPGTPIDVFNVLKRKAMQEFWLFHQNQHMSHTDFSKLVNISEDVFNTWKKCVEYFRSSTMSPNLKPVPNSISPNSHMSIPAFHSLDSSHPSDLQQFQFAKDGLFSMKDSNTAFKESKTAVQAGVLNSALSDSAARSLSNSYLASLQNMMFPWHSYYGMNSSIGQQMLPMMLWPGMMGLTGGIASSLGLMSGSHADASPQSSAVPGLHNSMLGAVSENTESVKSDESHSNHSDEQMPSDKGSGSGESQEPSRNRNSCDGEKRLKLSHAKDDVELLASVSRSRKQNKQEYIYYLKNPELCFKELEALFPSISLRTFYRWRKEMNAAVLLLEDSKNMTFHQFQMVFPDIPEDIFELWKERVGSACLSPSLDRQGQHRKESSEELSCSNQSLHSHDLVSKEQETQMDSHKTDLMNSQLKHNLVATSGTQPSGDSAALLRKNLKQGYYYVQKNPSIDFASFSRLYPDTSVRSFYRWKKELKDAVDFLKANPEMVYDAYKTVDTTVSEDVFTVWKTLALDDQMIKEEITEDSTAEEEMDTSMSNQRNMKVTAQGYHFLQLNPYIEFSQFARTYPDVPKHTFYRWKQEIQKIMSYIQAEPSTHFADITSVLPNVSEEAFNKWKQIIAADSDKPFEGRNSGAGTKAAVHKSVIDEDAKSQMTEALLYLMHNPTVKYSHFKTQFAFVSAAAFDLWLKRIKAVILFIASNPSIEYAAFSTSIKDVAKDIFEMWKNLSSDAIAALEIGCADDLKENLETGSSIIPVSQNSDKTFQTLEAFEFFQKNPKMSFSAFQTAYPTVSERLFSDWLSRTQEELQYIRDNPDLQLDHFSKAHLRTKQVGLDEPKCESSSGSKLQHIAQEASDLLEMETEENSVDGDLKPNLFRDEHKINDIEDQKAENRKCHKQSTEDYTKDNEVDSFNLNRSSDVGSKESSLSKLTKFADSGTFDDPSALQYTKKCLPHSLPPSFDQLLKNNNRALKLEPLFSSDNDSFVDVPDNTASAYHLHSKITRTPEVEAGEVCSINPPLSTSSLSALMAMSRNDDAHNRGNQESPPQMEKPGHNMAVRCSGSPNWQRSSNGPGGFGCGGLTKEDDEAFSSQRQKKMSRAEYLFVKDNPDVDSQEFSRIFPGVSARTFYRWKKEIKAQLHLP